MKSKSNLFLILAIFIASCDSDKKIIPDGLKKLSQEDQIEIAENRMTLDYDNVLYKNEKNEIITSDSIAKISFDESFAYDVFMNENNKPEIVIIRNATQEDKDFRKKIITIYQKEIVEPISLVEIDCDKIQEILTEVHSLDQDMRLDGNGIDPNIDRGNLIKVVSLIEKCGMPTLKEVNQEEMSAIWLVFQHANNYHRKQYLPQLKKSAQNGDLRMSQMALMEDRILMTDGKPQIYGSQISQNRENGGWMIYELQNPETVDKRRAEVGLGPLNEYVSQWEIEFKIKQAE